MSINVRLATKDDLPLLNHLYAEMDDKPELPLDKLSEIFEAIAHVPDYHIYLVQHQDQIVGTFSLLFVPTAMHRGFHKFAIVDAVTVLPQYRGQGLGKVMMQVALQLSQDADCYKLTLSSNLIRTDAHAFYESLGFKQHGWSFSLIPKSKI